MFFNACPEGQALFTSRILDLSFSVILLRVKLIFGEIGGLVPLFYVNSYLFLHEPCKLLKLLTVSEVLLIFSFLLIKKKILLYINFIVIYHNYLLFLVQG